MTNTAAIAFVVSAMIAWILVPLLSQVADRIGLVDKPDNKRKLHKKPIPMVGGPSIFVAGAIVVSCILFFFRDQFSFSPDDRSELPALLIGASIILLIGIVDDIFGVRGRQKLMGQILAITVLIVAGFQFDKLNFFGMKFDFGDFGVLVVYVWMIAAINSINLLDGADGFASTIGTVMFAAFGVMGVFEGKVFDSIIAFAMAGALLAFLRFNFPPAKAFLGDSGSMLIGFMLGALAIRCAFKQATAYAFFAPIALLAVPFLDTSAAIIRRRLTGRSIYTVDRGHLHHRLQKQGYGPRISLLWVALLCVTTGIGGILSLIYRNSAYALVSIGIVVLVLFLARIFGLAEFRLVSNKAMSISRSFVRFGRKQNESHQNTSVHMQGSQNWEDLWKQVCEFAEDHELLEITMDLNVPWLHESFHATQRKAGGRKDGSREWYLQIPLLVQGRIFGRLEVLGDSEGRFTHHDVVKNLLKISSDVERALLDMESANAVETTPEPKEEISTTTPIKATESVES